MEAPAKVPAEGGASPEVPEAAPGSGGRGVLGWCTPGELAFILALPLAVALYGMAQFQGFVQDDAYISLRFAANLAHGDGLLFNPGEPCEGFTNMLWTLLGALFYAVGLPVIRLWQLLGVTSALASVAMVGWIAGNRVGRSAAFGAALVLAASTTLHAWSPSGMESAAFMACLVGAFVAEDRGRTDRAFLLLGVAQWIRPEAVMAAASLLYVKLGCDWAAGELGGARVRLRLRQLLGFLVPLVMLLLLRRGYYSEWVPNTYLVKGAGVAANHLLGLRKLEKLLHFDGQGLIWVLAVVGLIPAFRGREAGRWALGVAGFLAFVGIDVYLNDGGFWKPGWSLFQQGLEALQRPEWDVQMTAVSGLFGGLGLATLTLPRHLRERPVFAWMGCLWLGYLYYYVRVGGDLLPMHRLFLPALPAQVLLAAYGASRLAHPDGPVALVVGRVEDDEETRGEMRGAAFTLAVAAALVAVALSLKETQANGHFRTVEGALEACHGAAGRDLQAVAEKHGIRPLALSQDMGVLPMRALGVDFLDAIGLCSRGVAKILWKYRYSPYYRYLIWQDDQARGRILEMEEELRAYITRRRPDYAVINVHVESAETGTAREAMETLDSDFFLPRMHENTFFYRWTDTAEFKDNFVLERVYEYSPIHFMVTYRRRDAPALLPAAD